MKQRKISKKISTTVLVAAQLLFTTSAELSWGSNKIVTIDPNNPKAKPIYIGSSNNKTYITPKLVANAKTDLEWQLFRNAYLPIFPLTEGPFGSASGGVSGAILALTSGVLSSASTGTLGGSTSNNVLGSLGSVIGGVPLSITAPIASSISSAPFSTSASGSILGFSFSSVAGSLGSTLGSTPGRLVGSIEGRLLGSNYGSFITPSLDLIGATIGGILGITTGFASSLAAQDTHIDNDLVIVPYSGKTKPNKTSVK